MCWLAQQKIYLRARAHLAVPNEFNKQKTEWNWEVSALCNFSSDTSILNCYLVWFWFLLIRNYVYLFAQFEDEFRRYLPIYIDMLKEVDAILDSSKVFFSFLKKILTAQDFYLIMKIGISGLAKCL